MEPPAKTRRIEGFRGSATAAVHADALAAEEEEALRAAFSTAQDVAPPLSVSTTFTSTGDGHIYSRISAPGRSRCETLLGALEGTEEQPAHAVLYSSGLAAAFALFSHFMPRRVFITGGYHGTHQVLAQLSKISLGQAFQKLPLMPPQQIRAELREGDVIWLETPLNPTCEVADIAAYAKVAKEAKAVLCVDGTFAPPPLQRPLLLGADAVMHATTKSLAGHSDVLGGAVCVAEESAARAAQLRSDRVALGATPGNLEVWLLMRSLRTLHLRVERQSATATQLAQWLHQALSDKSHALAGLVHAVHHPSLSTEPYVANQMKGGGGCLALELATEQSAKKLPEVLRLFRNATSLGGVESLIEWRRRWDSAVSPLLLRISVGLEDFEHLQADLAQGIKASASG
ncbi:unnamed protein product [Effrenium voratum]|uniref:Cystathionine gamma-synthase n=1 Tax=Effrenium voratum TaxID=2562239 RepID=A0AA36ML03_9DINO|nr:unnamed protein product [Effrenium voratum]CAJ1426836.1 unnamed protein product [Effrenium voratum]